jgi:hypothetical protein
VFHVNGEYVSVQAIPSRLLHVTKVHHPQIAIAGLNSQRPGIFFGHLSGRDFSESFYSRLVKYRYSVADPDQFGPDPDPTSENRPDPDSDPDPAKTGSGFI